MSVDETTYERVNDYGSVKIGLASPHDIRSWSFGEVKKPETINYRTYRPERDGLFCERIFGPEKDWECACGKYRGMKYKGMICDRCGVKVTHSRVRRKRMGHIELAAPVVHIWFFKSKPSSLGALLNMKTTSLEKVVYFQDYVVVDPGDTALQKCQLLTEEEARQARAKYGEGTFEIDMGAEAVKKLLLNLNVVELSDQLREELKLTGSQQKMKDCIKRLKISEALRDSDNRPEWMVLDVVPVIPPDLRPLVLLDSGNFATSDLNDLYRRIINKNNRLKKLMELNAPEVIVRNEKRMLQQSVDALFDNNRCKRPVLGSSNRPLKSLTDMIKGKQGRFRENLLGKRVDYSARSVIVVGPELKLNQCGLPKKIALELFQPFVIRRLKELGHADSIKSAKRILEHRDEIIWEIFDEVVTGYPVLLNRAPTLHRMGIQAFEPILIEDNAIKLHPLVCKCFNADFDGDQMAVHLPLSVEAQVEATTLMMSTNNIFSPANGQPIISASQDIVMGCYYLTQRLPGCRGDNMVFASTAEVHLAFSQGKVARHAAVKVRMPKDKRVKGEGADTCKPGGLIDTTVGRVIFNDALPEAMSFYNMTIKSKDLANIISDCHLEMGRRATIELLDDMKELGFRESTRSGLSFAASDLKTAPNRDNVIHDAEQEVMKQLKLYERGIITNQERYNKVLDTWTHAREQITKSVMHELAHDVREAGAYVNPIYLMSDSGARGGVEQIRQLAGMRGLIAKPSGEIIETPIKANFREGLSVLEYFSSTHGARKGLADTALKTADSGYLMRKLANTCQDMVVTTHDCGTAKGITRGIVYRGEKIEVSLADAIRGRVSRQNIVNPITDELIVREDELITVDIARKIEEMGLEKIQVRSPMTCEASLGICRLCYGMDLSTGALVEEGLAAGIVAAQSIGEPGTQLTMRTYHFGGTAARDIEEYELRAGKSGRAQFARIRSVVNADGNNVVLARNGEVIIVDPKERELESYTIPKGATLLVAEGDEVKEGQVLCQWDPHSVLILAEAGGRVRFEDCIEGRSMRSERDASGIIRRTIIKHESDLHPQIILQDGTGKILDFYYLPEGASIEVAESQQINAGTIIAKDSRVSRGTQDIIDGLQRVTELFEARRPVNPVVVAEVSGEVEFVLKKQRGKRLIVVRAADGTGIQHVIPNGQELLVHAGDVVSAGDALVRGQFVPHDILRTRGKEAVQQYLLNEIQSVYRNQGARIDDKHIEIVIAQMLRKVKVMDVGDTNLVPGGVIDQFEFQQINEKLAKCGVVTDPGDTDFQVGDIVPMETIEEVNAEVEAAGQRPAETVRPRPATSSIRLLGITKAALQCESFISAASFEDTRKVLTGAALAGKTDYLVGLKENLILGRIIPAGTGFPKYRGDEVRTGTRNLLEKEASRKRVPGQVRKPTVSGSQNKSETPEVTQPDSGSKPAGAAQQDAGKEQMIAPRTPGQVREPKVPGSQNDSVTPEIRRRDSGFRQVLVGQQETGNERMNESRPLEESHEPKVSGSQNDSMTPEVSGSDSADEHVLDAQHKSEAASDSAKSFQPQRAAASSISSSPADESRTTERPPRPPRPVVKPKPATAWNVSSQPVRTRMPLSEQLRKIPAWVLIVLGYVILRASESLLETLIEALSD